MGKKYIECDSCGQVVLEKDLNEMRIKTTFKDFVIGFFLNQKTKDFKTKKVCEKCVKEKY